MRHLSIPPSYDLPVARTLKEAEKSKLFFLKKREEVFTAWLASVCRLCMALGGNENTQYS